MTPPLPRGEQPTSTTFTDSYDYPRFAVRKVLDMSTSAIKAWRIESQQSDLSGLVLKDGPAPDKLGDDEVLVEMRAASLNYRDLVLATVGPLHSCNIHPAPS